MNSFSPHVHFVLSKQSKKSKKKVNPYLKPFQITKKCRSFCKQTNNKRLIKKLPDLSNPEIHLGYKICLNKFCNNSGTFSNKYTNKQILHLLSLGATSGNAFHKDFWI